MSTRKTHTAKTPVNGYVYQVRWTHGLHVTRYHLVKWTAMRVTYRNSVRDVTSYQDSASEKWFLDKSEAFKYAEQKATELKAELTAELKEIEADTARIGARRGYVVEPMLPIDASKIKAYVF